VSPTGPETFRGWQSAAVRIPWRPQIANLRYFGYGISRWAE